MKKPLTHIRGRESQQGDAAEASRLAKWFRLTETDASFVTQGIHGVHPYPGRLHPLWARRILTHLAREIPDCSVLDSFCGSGTVLVEARQQNIYARGSDINPIAIRLARLRNIPHPDPAAIRAEAQRCAEGCLTRRKTPFSILASQDKEAFPPHVLAGLISLRDEIEKCDDRRVREVLLFSLSPLLDKLAAKPKKAAPRVPRTAVRDFFLERVDRWIHSFEAMKEYGWAEAEHADARWLPWKPGSASAVITSPPYPGVYDYLEAQRRRMLWLGDDSPTRPIRKKEIGRRGGPGLWVEDMGRSLGQLCRSTKPGSPFYLVLADGVQGKQVIRADEAIRRMCTRLPLTFVAAASQARPHYHQNTEWAFRGRARHEHLILLRRTEDPEPPPGQGPSPRRKHSGAPPRKASGGDSRKRSKSAPKRSPGRKPRTKSSPRRPKKGTE